MSERPQAVAFDVVETLFSLEAVRSRLVSLGLPGATLEHWFAGFLRDAVALSAAGPYTPFRPAAAGSLAVFLGRHGVDPSDETVDGVLAGFGELDAHPDVRPALELLRDRAVPAVALSNGAADATGRLLARSGLEPLLPRVFSIDEVRRWKPFPEPYLHAAAQLGLRPGQLAMVAVHAWDVHGAKRAGLLTGWANRLEGRWHPAMVHPDVVGSSLVEVVEGLVG
ncbi:MAG: haloacid dehalogenase type II [Acidimicrobiia bacterium]